MLAKTWVNKCKHWKYVAALFLCFLFFPCFTFAQPANNDCANASIVNISGSGFGLGVFTSAEYDITAATLQTGETFAESINTAGLNKKSVWYKFTLPSTRGVRISLAQPGSAIQAGNLGFAVYKANACVPVGADLSTKLTAIETFGNTYHPCVESGDYYIQVSGNNLANGLIYITVETTQSTAVYDKPNQAFDFGILTPGIKTVNYDVNCLSLEDGAEICTALSNYQDFNKSSWHVFKTPAYFDYLIFLLADNNLSTTKKFGYTLYQGDVRSNPYSALSVIDGCDSIQTSADIAAKKIYRCNDLLPNTTYSIQLFFKNDYNANVKVALVMGGVAPTRAPEPIISGLPALTNKLGTLATSAAGVATSTFDYLGCNSQHVNHPCEPTLPANGVLFGGKRYNLSTFFTFSTSGTSELGISAANPATCGPQRLVRLYRQNVSNNCSTLDTTNIVKQFLQSGSISCFPPGDYTLQVLGQDTADGFASYFYDAITDYNGPGLCPLANLGSRVDLNITVASLLAENKFSLSAPGKYDAVNANGAGIMQPLVSHVTYNMPVDTMGCANTVMPDTTCDNSTKGSFHEFVVADSGSISTTSWCQFYTRVYRGDANALVTVQNMFNYPEKITGMPPISNCIGNPLTFYPNVLSDNFCVTPGTYTMVGFANLLDPYGRISIPRDMSVTLRTTKAKYNSPAKAENMGDLWAILGASGGTFISQRDTFTCYENPATIDGLTPCLLPGYNTVASKLAYRQFYLSKATLATIETTSKSRLFSGKATDGIAGLKLVSNAWDCFTNVGNDCLELPAGWYTVVTYGWGPNFAIPADPLNQGTSSVNTINGVKITLKLPLCSGPSFNRPYKAAIDLITQQPFLIQWAPRVGHTAAYPKTDTTYTLPTETFGCANDTPFISHPVAASCGPLSAKVAYWVFKITQESFVSINTENYWHGWTNYFGYSVMVYAGNARKDSALFATAQPIQPCLLSLGHTQLSKLQPGEYTIVIFAPGDAVCKTVTPKIYIDQVGYSRFDHASNAYDFGQIKPDSTWYNGKPGDVNPLNPGRAPSNDFFYCTTGAQTTDPIHACSSVVLQSIYNSGNNVPLFTSNHFPGYPYLNYPLQPSRNLWYTFTVNKGGQVRVRVKNKTIQKGWIYNFVVVKSNVDGNLPFSTVVSSGGVDSTLAQGLVPVVVNTPQVARCTAYEEASFFIDACSPIAERYYIVVASSLPSNGEPYNPEWMYPNHQVEVEVLFDSVNAILPKFDHHYQANNIGTNLGPGTYTGATDNINCATVDVTDPGPPQSQTCIRRNLWYKFSTTVSGSVKLRAYKEGLGLTFQVQLYREIINGDSTANGLQEVNLTNSNWSPCITPGTYYLLIIDCDPIGLGIVYPQIEITELAGDYCSKPVISALAGAGSSTATANIGCHTIGTDYGEFNPTLTCPPNALTKDYKSSWYRLDITGTDTLDVTVFINENTNTSSGRIKYRMMTGSCNAMQEQSCVQDALTRNTYKCLAPGKSYFIQVFTPLLEGSVLVTGSIDLNVTAVKHADSCQPQPPCIAVANFSTQFDCNKDRNVQFINSSTYGTSIQYEWDFGFNNQKSTAIVPQFFYPALATDATYTARLIVTNTDCGKKDTSYQIITMPARPFVNLGNDTIICTKGTVFTLDATSHPGSTYEWYFGGTSPVISLSPNGTANPFVKVTYKNCESRDTIKIYITPLAKRGLQTLALCSVSDVNLNANQNQNETYQWNTGATTSSINVNMPGYYWCDLILNGCVIRDSFLVISPSVGQSNKTITICQKDMPYAADATISGASSYKWNDNNTNAKRNIATPGIWWVDVTISGCTIRDSLTLEVDSFKNVTTNARICGGQSYSLPSGKPVTTSGLYRDTIRNVRGCDSLITNVTLAVDTVKNLSNNVSICGGQSYTLPSGKAVSIAGFYADTVHYKTSNCDSLITNLTLTVATVSRITQSAVICAGVSYRLPSGKNVNTAAIYQDTLRAQAGCDSVIYTINLGVDAALVINRTATICNGNTYTLPGGRPVTIAGLYRDTIRNVRGCDSVITNLSLKVDVVSIQSFNAYFFTGQTYTLPWGSVTNTAGIYRDTLKSVAGCDSLITIVDLKQLTVQSNIRQVLICAGGSYSLPWGGNVNRAGSYADTIKSTTGADSLLNIVVLMILPRTILTPDSMVCQDGVVSLRAMNALSYAWSPATGLSGVNNAMATWTAIMDRQFRLTTTHTHPDGGTISCTDSVRIEVVAKRFLDQNSIICEGQIYTLPSGRQVSTTGLYSDTLRSASGCDSLITNINLTVQSSVTKVITASFCEGQTYLLPWGKMVGTAGVFRDTLRYLSGCDSLIRTVNLLVNPVTKITSNVDICSGKNYTLPWGITVNASGVYGDTVRYLSGCDSLVRIVNLTVQNPPAVITNVNICEGQTYTLPSGIVVNSTGQYIDTIHSVSGCDSVWRTVNLVVQKPVSFTTNATICSGQNYTLPWGAIVSTTGIYNDTIHYNTGCDSLRRTVNLTVQLPVSVTTNSIICEGQTYTLPWGRLVGIGGVYHDTLHYNSGCDSVWRTVNLTVQKVVFSNVNAIVCQGQLYTLPWGTIVSKGGVYRDTLKYIGGCDSLVRIVNLTLQTVSATTTDVNICGGERYTLPWGAVVSNSGIYRDTLRYTSGCDSVRRTINLKVQTIFSSSINAAICAGKIYSLPSGAIVNKTGIYPDTLHYSTGCDSLRVMVNLTVTAAAIINTTKSICSDETYILPWGPVVNTAGNYRDTLRTAGGCDSLIRSVALTVRTKPVISVTKSNDVNCIIGRVKLNAYGADKYVWTPASSLDNAFVNNPIATPTQTTRYVVTATAINGCIAKDSIEVKLLAIDPQKTYLVPTSFTPNNDGLNDCFGVPYWGNVTDFNFTIYNRYGKLMFQTTNPGNCWDGRYSGANQNSGAYVYFITARGICGSVNRKGTVMLVR